LQVIFIKKLFTLFTGCSQMARLKHLSGSDIHRSPLSLAADGIQKNIATPVGNALPAYGHDVPACRHEMPRIGQSMPPSGHGMPAVSHGISACRQGTPASGQRMPHPGHTKTKADNGNLEIRNEFQLLRFYIFAFCFPNF
jgi:hypothetical protein